MIIIIGSEEEEHSIHMYTLLKTKNHEVCFLDTRQLPGKMSLSWHASLNDVMGSFIINDKKFYFNDIKSVYWRWNYGICINPVDESNDAIFIAQMVQRETHSAIESIFSVLDCLWVNSLEAIELHKKKSFQLHLMKKAGIRVPETLITNDKEELIPFYEHNNCKIIYKPVRGGAITEQLMPGDLTEDRLDALKFSPVQFQEFIEGVDIRVYGIGDQLFPAEIRATTIDFRNDSQAQIVPIEIPDYVKSDCLKTMKILNLNFSGIDIRRSHTGEYVFIEANPSPMFINFERQSGYPISETLAEMLIKGK